ncbi:MAG: outer membrane beta-barrel protein [Candidatus Binatia bacterium]|nr:outer membrane beta-barrel protein [Candidatus Binatia bacterium]MDG2011695.1 outer membrane beta-barrel protein [Candidatus Binatia bacterium]
MAKFPWNLVLAVIAATLLVAAAPASAAVLGGVAEPYARSLQAKDPDFAAIPPLDWVDNRTAEMQEWLANRQIHLGLGFSAAYIWNANDPFNGKNTLRPLADNANSVAFELFQLELGLNPNPDFGELGLNVKLDAGRFARRIKADWNGTGLIPDTTWEYNDVEFQEAWLAFNIKLGKGLLVKAGRLTTLLGAEVLEPWKNVNFSRSFLFGYAIPRTHTGAYATYQVTDMIALTGGAVVGWDNVEDNNHSASGIGQLAIRPNEKFQLYMSGIIGPEQTCLPNPGAVPPLSGRYCNSNNRGVVDVVIGMTPLPGLNFTLNYDFGSESGASVRKPGKHASWSGFSGIASYTYNRWQAGLRGEWFQDGQGARTGVPQTLWAVSLDARVFLSDGLYLRSEYRHDESDRAVFTGNTPNKLFSGQDTIAIEIGYSL